MYTCTKLSREKHIYIRLNMDKNGILGQIRDKPKFVVT